MLVAHGDELCCQRSHRLLIAENHGVARNEIARAMLLDDAQHVAAQEETAIRRDRIPRRLVEEINTVGKREMETARAMAFPVALVQLAQGGGGFMQGISGF